MCNIQYTLCLVHGRIDHGGGVVHKQMGVLKVCTYSTGDNNQAL
jgi:hypothetical protein